MKKKKRNKLTGRLCFVVMACLIIGSLGSTYVFATGSDIPDKGWDRLIGSNKTDQFNDVITTADGNILAVGSTVDNSDYPQNLALGDEDGMLVKTDARGTILWKAFVGGAGHDKLNAVVELTDGSILAAGTSTSSASGDIRNFGNGNSDGFLAKYSANGTLVWTKLVGGSKLDIFRDVITTSDGGFLAVGNSYSSKEGSVYDLNNGVDTSDGYMVKFNAAGNTEWDNLFGSPQYDYFYSVIQTSDNGYIVAGNANGGADGKNTGGEITDTPSANNPMPNDALLAKFNESGMPVWNNLFGGPGGETFYGITGTSDGGCVVVGETNLMGGDITTGESTGQTTALAAKFNGAGVTLWNRAFTAGGYPILKSIMKTTSGNYIAVGKSLQSYDNVGTQGLLANLNDSGSVIDYKFVGGNGEDEFNALAIDQSGHVITAGTSNTSANGTILSNTNGGRDGLLSYFGQSNYKVIFEENGGLAIPDQIVAFGNPVAGQVSTEKPGYSFIGWYTDPELTQGYSIDAPILQDTTLYAKWSINSYDVIFNENGGTFVNDQIVVYNNLAAQPQKPKRTGYTFGGWYSNSDCTGLWTFPTDKVVSTTTLFAKWTPNKYIIKFRGNGATSGAMVSLAMTYDAPKALPAKTYKKTGYSFLGWAKTSTGPVVYKNAATVKNLTATNKGTVTLYARWGAAIKSASSVGYNSVKVTWRYAGSATSYKIYRATKATGTYSLVHTAKSTSRYWKNTGLVTGKTYYYKVYPVVKGKVFVHKRYKSAKPIPGTPTTTLTKASAHSIRVAWKGVSGTTKYQIYRATSATGRYSLVYTASPKLRSWTNTGLVVGKTYYYKVKAYHLEKTTKVFSRYSSVKFYKL